VATTAQPALGVAARLVDAIAGRDFAAAESCFAPDARMRALVPLRLRDESGAAAIVARMRFWWEEGDDHELVDSELESLADRIRFRWRIRHSDPELGLCVQEQSGYLACAGDRIATLNLVCSGDRPIAASDS
jgi:hypothetical protein